MLGQAAAMLIPLPTLITTQLTRDSLPFSANQMRAFASPSIPVLGTHGPSDGAAALDCGILINRTRRLLPGRGTVGTGAVDAAGEIGTKPGGCPHGARLHPFATAETSTVRGSDGNGHRFPMVVEGRCHSGGSIGRCGGRHTLPAGHSMVRIDCTQGDGMGVVSGVGLSDRSSCLDEWP